MAASIRGVKTPKEEDTDPEVLAEKAAVELLDNLNNNFNIFFDTLELNASNKTVDYTDLLRAICHNTSVRHVAIDSVFLKAFNNIESRILLELVAGMPKLESLTIHFTPEMVMKPMTLAKVLYRIKHLKELHLFGLQLLGDEYDMESLGEVLEGLTSLKNVSFNQLGLQEPEDENDDPIFPDHIVNPLASLPALEEVTMTSSRRLAWDEDSLGGLCDSKTLKTLKLKNMQLDASQVGAMAEVLQGDSRLEHLQLCDCELDEEGWRSFATLLPDNTTLQILDLSQSPTMDDEACFVVASCMESNAAVKVLKLHHDESSQITGHGIRRVFRMLEKNTTLECLEISFTADDDSGFKAVADALLRNNTLKELYIENFASKVSTKGVVAIAKALETQNTTLEHIGIVFDGVDSEGVLALAQAMQKSPSLKRFAFNRAEYRSEIKEGADTPTSKRGSMMW